MSAFADTLAFFRIAAEAGTYPDGDASTTQPWDIGWFYRDPLAGNGADPASGRNLNALCRAYLGDNGARARLAFGEADDGEVDAGMLEGRFFLNARQRLAVRRALDSDISLVQGPPGTGKTETILNMASCMLARGATVAVVSTNRDALANITKKVAGYAGASPEKEPRRHRLFGSYAPLGSVQMRSAWNAAHPDEAQFRVGGGDGALHNDRQDTGGWEPDLTAGKFLSRRPFITSTIHSLKKCFADGDAHQFDYVIMDEASQCAPALALIAMSSARHLVLVGDTEQLPPVFQAESGRTAARAAQRAGAPVPEPGSPYAMQDPLTGDGMSILASAQTVFEPLGAPRTFLNEHFRCHPGIIGFCSEEVYAPRGERLDVRTPDYDGNVQTPIRIRWFEGDYWEPHRADAAMAAGAPADAAHAADGPDAEDTRHPAEGGKDDGARISPAQSSKENRKQIEIFMREEWPRLRARLEADDGFSVRIISPFRGQLQALYERLASEVGARAVDLLFPGEDKGGTGAPGGKGKRREDGDAWQRTGLTVHKTQGQEYNAVYLLPVEDGDWDWPWSQGRSLVNVAASRAKDELVVICSSSLMSRDTQLALTGAFVPPSGGAAAKGLSDRERMQREERERFLQKLVDYVRARTDPASPSFTGEVGFPESRYGYGFHRTALDSAFDRVPVIHSHVKSEDSSAELALCLALADVDLERRGMAVARNVPLSACFSERALSGRLTDDGEFDAASKRAFIMECEEGYESHFDFVLYERSTRRIVLCIEVDGGQHRYVSPADASDCEGKLAYRRQAYRKKDAIALDMGAMLLHGNDSLGVMRAASGGPYTFTMLRLATNGTSACETERLAGTGGSASRGFATIERLIDGQLECGAGSWPTINPAFDLDECAMPDCADIKAQVGKAVAEDDEARPISKILRGWRESGSMPRALRAQDVNRALQDAGLIERREEGWFATPLGRRLGIREKTVEDRKDGASYCIYPASCEDELLTVVREGLEA